MTTGQRTYLAHLDWALTANDDDREIRDATLVIEDDHIVAVGPSDEILLQHPPARVDELRDARRLGVTPGFVDAHVHLSETLSRAVVRAPTPFRAHLNDHDEHISVLLGMTEMLRHGTTCFLDMGARTDPGVTARAAAQAGIRGIVGRHAADNRPDALPPGWSPQMADRHFFGGHEAALDALEQGVRDWNGFAGGRIRCWVAIEGRESCTLELHVGARALAERLGVGATYHVASTIEESQDAARRHGRWPVTRIAEHGGLGTNLVLAHAVAVNDHEVELLAHYGTSVAFCPTASLRVAKGAAAIGKYPEMRAAGVTVAVGTGGVTGAGSLDLMRQQHLVAGLLQDARAALRMSTIEGARALGWDDEIGSLEPGKKADFVLFDLDHLDWVPFDQPLEALIWSASSASIAETWVDGRRLYHDGRFRDVDADALRVEARARAAAIAARGARTTSDDAPLTTAARHG